MLHYSVRALKGWAIDHAYASILGRFRAAPAPNRPEPTPNGTNVHSNPKIMKYIAWKTTAVTAMPLNQAIPVSRQR